VFGSIVTAILCWALVPILGIAGGATATTIACFLMMVPCIYFAFKMTKTKVPALPVLKILAATGIMALAGYMIPKTTLWLFPGIIICIIVYFFALILVRFFTEEDIETLRGYSSKLGPLSSVANKILNFVERIEFRNK
jgi:stage V sporulation protein B